MNGWMVRAVALGGLVVVARLLLGYAMLARPTNSGWLRPVLFAVVLLTAVLWGLVDGRRDRARSSSSDPGVDSTRAWLVSSVAAGVGSGVASWLLDFVPTVHMGDNPLFFELTSGAAFIVLILFLPGTLGVTLGRWGGERLPSA
jgi:hypothetical protein